MNSQLLFSLKEVIVSYHKYEIFHDLDLNIQRKDFIALVGKNGVGKSTLMNVISGNHEIDKGEIWNIDNISVSYFSQNLQFDNENQSIEHEVLTILENHEEDFQIDIFCNFMNLDKNLILKNLSGGQKRRVGSVSYTHLTLPTMFEV